MFKRVLRSVRGLLGAGFVAGASDNDPTSVAAYSQSGAVFGYGLLWTALYALPFMTAVQEMAGRIGLVTGNGLSGVIRKHYSKKILYGAVSLLLIANIFTIGADLGAMAESLQLLSPFPFLWLLLVVTLFPLLLEIVIPYPTYAKFLKYLSLVLFAYLFTAIAATRDWTPVIGAIVVPHIELSHDFLMNLAAVLGTTISPYLFFWQSDEEVEEEIVAHRIRGIGIGRPQVRERDVANLRWGTAIGMIFSQVITMFIIITAAGTLGANGITDIKTAADAANALRPLAGDLSYVLFALGILGTGLLAVPVLAGSAAYALSEMFGWRAGLGISFRRARAFYFIIIIATVSGLVVNLLPIDPIKLLYYAAILNGLIAPILMALMLSVANNKRIMGARTNSLLSNIFGVIITALMGGVALLLLWQWIV